MKRSARLAATTVTTVGRSRMEGAVQELCGVSSKNSTKNNSKKSSSKTVGRVGSSSATVAGQGQEFNKKAEVNSASVEPGHSSFSKVKQAKKTNKDINTAGRLGRSFFDQDCIQLSRALLGKVLCRRITATGEILRGTIVETEAYPGGEDKASQSYQGRRTPKNEAMYMDPGTAYVYFTYGMYYCFNISSRGEGSACLLRGVEPHEDYDTMHRFRLPKPKKNKTGGGGSEDEDKPQTKRKKLNTYELANGPSKLCIAFDISRDNSDKVDMATSDDLWLEQSEDMKFRNGEFEIALDKRIGIESTPPEARNQLWRFYVKDSWAESRAKVGELKKKAKLLEQTS